MSGLSLELYNRCRTVLLKCREFQDYRALRAVFVTEHLFPFRIGLPSADSPADLIDRCLDYLVDKRLTGGRPVLPIFIATIRDHYQPGDALCDDLEDLYNAVHEAMGQSVPQTTPTPRRKHLLYDRLLQLDFRPQIRMVKEVIEEHRIAAFLIHGPPDYGQRTLTYRLTRLKPEWEAGQHIVIDAGSNGVGKSSRALWGQVARKLQLPYSTTPEELTAKVGEWWQTQDVIFVFHAVDYMPTDLLSAWIEEFWEPLAAMARQTEHQTHRRTHLLLFLVDYAGIVCRSNLLLARHPQDLYAAPRPLLLPAIEPFPEPELEIWIDAAAEVLPTGLSVKTLVAAPCNGVPELIYERICEYCGFSWEGEIAR